MSENDKERKWLPNIAELIDRMSINQLKEVFITEHKERYAEFMEYIANDIDIIIKEENIELTGDIIRLIIALAQLNTHIWYNESKARSGEDQDIQLLKLTHGLNGLRSKCMNNMLALINQEYKQDLKTDCLAAEFKDWSISILDKK